MSPDLIARSDESQMTDLLELADELKLDVLEERLEFASCIWEYVSSGNWRCFVQPQ